ncbi:hypothetical protein [Saccharothrix sp. HUAS TT1]|uniref:hypothetical protein n=1 Tax=unclassified Saccharothrix TaxID=2593673 RepID=UPI00345C32E8
MATVPDKLPADIERKQVEAALAALGIPKDGLRSVHLGITSITCRYLDRDATMREPRGTVEAEAVIPIKG